jgi:hypothetical protein
MAELNDLFIRCVSCGLVAEPGSADALLLDGDRIDATSGKSTAQCAPCGRSQPLTAEVVVDDRTGTYTCRGCGDTRACPADAARVQCRGCGVYGMGPGTADPAAADRLRITEGLHNLELRSTYERAVRRRSESPD